MAQSRKQIEGTWVYFPTGVSLERKRGKLQIVETHYEDGKAKRKFYPATLAGLAEASAAAKARREEKKKYGAGFGNISEDEKMAIDLWRQYRSKCNNEGCGYIPMSEMVKRALDAYTQETITPYFKDVTQMWLDMMRRKNISSEHLRKRTQKVVRFNSWFGNVRISNITIEMFEKKLDGLVGRNGKEVSARTRQDYMGCLFHIFSFALKREIIAKNPFKAMEKPNVDKPERETISVEDAVTILAWLIKNPTKTSKAYFVGVVLNLFCGVRPAELTRLKFGDLFTGGRNELYLSRTITKTHFDRRSVLRENVVSWLQYFQRIGIYGNPEEYIIRLGNTERNRGDNYSHFLIRVTEETGVKIPRDSLRHTAATMISALVGMGSAAEELGNDVRTLAKHYRHAVPRREALEFFSISPSCLTMSEVKAVAKKMEKKEAKTLKLQLKV